MNAKDLDIEKWKSWFTVQDLLNYIKEHNVDLNAPILVRRVEDYYYEKGGWTTVKKEGESYHCADIINKKIESGEFDDKERYPLMDNPQEYFTPPEKMEELKEEYTPISFPVLYKGDNKLYLDLHY